MFIRTMHPRLFNELNEEFTSMVSQKQPAIDVLED